MDRGFGRSKFHFFETVARFWLSFENMAYFFYALWHIHEFSLTEMKVSSDVFTTIFESRLPLMNFIAG